jgi:hypothetical protein
VTGPLIGLLWADAALASHAQAVPWQWASMPACGTAAMDIILLALLVSRAASTPGRLAVLAAAVAAAASLTRFTLAARATRSCLTTRVVCP